MEKLKLHTPDLAAEKMEKLAELLPSCITEALDEQGKLTRSVDFDQLRQELSDHIIEGPRERYHLDWPGKREAMLTANTPVAKTLRPCRPESVDFGTTKNIFIEGDNLDALKLLRKPILAGLKSFISTRHITPATIFSMMTILRSIQELPRTVESDRREWY